MNVQNPNRVIRLPEVMNMVGMCKASIYNMIKAGQFPVPLKLGPRASGWVLSEVDTWINERICARAGK